MRAFLVLIFLSLPVSAQVLVEPSAGDVPPLGEVRLSEAGKETIYTTFDFSVGAFDASAWLEGMGGAPRLHVTAYPDGDPQAQKGLLRIEAGFARSLAPGMITQEAKVEILMGKSRDGRRWTSEGKMAEVEIFDFVPQEAGVDTGYGRLTGRFSARICSGDGAPAVVAPNARCRDVSGLFATEAQFQP